MKHFLKGMAFALLIPSLLQAQDFTCFHGLEETTLNPEVGGSSPLSLRKGKES